jgi:uncharacterized protein YcgL (UPF0745 family)
LIDNFTLIFNVCNIQDVDFKNSNPTERARPAALHLFFALIRHAPDAGCPVVLDALSSLMKSCPPVVAAPSAGDAKMVLMKEALYNAFCASPLDLQEYLKSTPSLNFNFVQWYESTLRHEIMSTEPSLHFLRRRVLALLGDWAERLPPPLVKAVFGHGVTLLSGTDIVTSLSALTVLHNMIESLVFADDGGDDDDDDDDEKSSRGAASSDAKKTFVDTSVPSVTGVTLTPNVMSHLSAASTPARLLMEYGQPICAAIFAILPRLHELHHRQQLLEEVTHVMQTLGSYLKYLPPLVEGVMAQLAFWWKACEKDVGHSDPPTVIGLLIVYHIVVWLGCMSNRNKPYCVAPSYVQYHVWYVHWVVIVPHYIQQHYHY